MLGARTPTVRVPAALLAFILIWPMLALLPSAAGAQTPSLQVLDVESLRAFIFDATVTCPIAFGTWVSGGEGCPTGRAPSTGECGLDYICPLTPPVTVPDALLSADHVWAQLAAL